ncbi:MAG TPA: hypothetical protein VGF99_10625, partial [Myxococcota bacterium]
MRRFLIALSLLAAIATPAAAQREAGAPLTLLHSFQGPFQHAVVGSALVEDDGTVLPVAGADLALPPGATVRLAELFWMGSRTATPDDEVTFRRPDGSRITVPAEDCIVALDVVNGRDGDDYYQCRTDVTSFVAAGGSLSGRYEVGDADFDGFGPAFGENPELYLNLYSGGFALVVVYTDPGDTYPRLLQVLNGLRAQDGTATIFMRSNVAAFNDLELSDNGGRLTHVCIEGDPEVSGNERLDLCRGPCVGAGAVPTNTLRSDLLTSAVNPENAIFNETIDNALGQVANVTLRNGIDIDTYDLASAHASTRAANQYFGANRLNVSSTTGNEMVAHALLIVEITDFDGDEDGLSNIEEGQTGTDPNNPDTDGDG